MARTIFLHLYMYLLVASVAHAEDLLIIFTLRVSTICITAAMGAVVKYCQSQGVLVLTAGTYSNVVRFLPPLVITDELLKDALSVLDDAFASL